MSKFESTRNIKHKIFLLSAIFINIFYTSVAKYFTQYRGGHPFRRVNTPYNTRGNDVNLIPPQFRTTLFKHSILCTGPQLWNDLPSHLKTNLHSANTPTFKKSLKTFLYNCQNT